MAYGEYGGLLPRETAYSSPAAYTEAAKVEAYKRASYLASMDQFYAELAESTRQFDLNLAWQKEAFEKELGLEEEKFEWAKEYGTEELGLKGRELDIAEQRMKNEYALGRGQISAQRYAVSSQAAIAERELELKEEMFDYERSMADIALPYLLEGQRYNLRGLSLDNQLKMAMLQETRRPVYTSNYGEYGSDGILNFSPPSSYIAEPE